MTQEQQTVQPPPGQPPVDDMGIKIYHDIQRHRGRLGRLTDPSLKKLFMELTDTVMEFVEAGFGYFLQFRNQTIHVIEGKDGVLESLVDIDARLNALEDEVIAAPLDDEDADVIQRVRIACEGFVRMALAEPTITTDGKEKLEAILADCAKVDEILASATADEDDDGEEGDEDELEEDESAGAINAAGSNGAS